MVYMLLGTGFEETEAVAPLDLLRRAGVEVSTVGLNGKVIYGAHGIGVEADITIGQMDLTNLEMIILPGGLGGVTSCRACPEAMEALRFAWDNGKLVGAICAGPTVLADLHITDGMHTTCFPGCEGMMGTALCQEGKTAVTDGRLITGTSAGCAIPFGLELIAALKGRDVAEQIREQFVIR